MGNFKAKTFHPNKYHFTLNIIINHRLDLFGGIGFVPLKPIKSFQTISRHFITSMLQLSGTYTVIVHRVL